MQLSRRDTSSSNKVHFCEQPPQEHSYEHCSRAEHAQLYYSVHELQKFLEELRLETTTAKNKQPTTGCGGSSGSKPATTASIVIVARST